MAETRNGQDLNLLTGRLIMPTAYNLVLTSSRHSNDDASSNPNRLSGTTLFTRLPSYSSSVASLSPRSTVMTTIPFLAGCL